MALFGKKKKDEQKKPEALTSAVSATKKTTNSSVLSSLSHVILKPRITEKATMHSASGIYAFDVANVSNKREVLQAVRELYKVTPIKVRVVTIPSKIKRSARTGKSGVRGGGKKAYVYLKKGDTITLH